MAPKSTSTEVVNPPLTFVVDTTESVEPDKNSIMNLTRAVVNRIQGWRGHSMNNLELNVV